MPIEPIGRTLALTLAALFAISALTPASARKKASEEEETVKAPLLISITSGREDLHSVTMAYQLADHGLEDGRGVTLFLSVRAPELASSGLPDTVFFRDNPPLKQMLADLIAKGGRVYVCPHCMAVHGLAEEDLVEGAAVASRETVFGPLDAGAGVFSF
jgi:uncharacterized protein